MPTQKRAQSAPPPEGADTNAKDIRATRDQPSSRADRPGTQCDRVLVNARTATRYAAEKAVKVPSVGQTVSPQEISQGLHNVSLESSRPWSDHAQTLLDLGTVSEAIVKGEVRVLKSTEEYMAFHAARRQAKRDRELERAEEPIPAQIPQRPDDRPALSREWGRQFLSLNELIEIGGQQGREVRGDASGRQHAPSGSREETINGGLRTEVHPALADGHGRQSALSAGQNGEDSDDDEDEVADESPDDLSTEHAEVIAGLNAMIDSISRSRIHPPTAHMRNLRTVILRKYLAGEPTSSAEDATGSAASYRVTELRQLTAELRPHDSHVKSRLESIGIDRCIGILDHEPDYNVTNELWRIEDRLAESGTSSSGRASAATSRSPASDVVAETIPSPVLRQSNLDDTEDESEASEVEDDSNDDESAIDWDEDRRQQLLEDIRATELRIQAVRARIQALEALEAHEIITNQTIRDSISKSDIETVTFDLSKLEPPALITFDLDSNGSDIIMFKFTGIVPGDDAKNKQLRLRKERLEEDCGVCLTEPPFDDEPLELSCGHIFCADCVLAWHERHATCPVCRQTVGKEDMVLLKVVKDEE